MGGNHRCAGRDRGRRVSCLRDRAYPAWGDLQCAPEAHWGLGDEQAGVTFDSASGPRKLRSIL